MHVINCIENTPGKNSILKSTVFYLISRLHSVGKEEDAVQAKKIIINRMKSERDRNQICDYIVLDREQKTYIKRLIKELNIRNP
jgi:mannose/fructose/N-acetylgalactosamine-specific phosphotransferase system component IIB